MQEWWKDAPVVSDTVPKGGGAIYIPPAGPSPEQQAEEARKQRAADLAEQAAARAASGEARAQSEFEGTGGKPTAEQQKTSILLARIKGGFADIQAVRERNPDAQEAGLGETLSRNVFGEGLITRSISGPDRRRVTDAQRDILDSLLTLSTGAAYTREQLEGQTLSYFPQYDDTPEEVADKNQRLERLIEAAKINAGPKWQEVDDAIAPLMPKTFPKAKPAEGSPIGIATGEEYATDEDIAVARELNAMWKAGATIEQLSQRSIELGGGPFTGEAARKLLEAGPANIDIVPRMSGRREPMSALGEIGTGLASGAFTGLTANLGDEAVGLIDPAAAEKLRLAQDFAQERAPVSSFLGEVAGGVASPLARIGGSAGTVVGEGIRGGIYGGLYGAGEGGPDASIQDRLTSAAIGAATGGAGGAGGARLMRGAAPAAPKVTGIADEITPAAGMTAQPVGDMETVVNLARSATGKGLGARKAKRELAKMAGVNPAAQEAADRLGMALPSDVLSDNAQLGSLVGLARSQVGSEAEAAWQRAARDAIAQSEAALDELGAVTDLAQLSNDVSSRITTTMQGLEKRADVLRSEVTAAFKPSDRVEANSLQRALGGVIQELGGLEQAKKAFTGEERRLLAMLGEGEVANTPTYAMIDRLRREMGEAIGKGKGPWVDTDMASLKRYYAALADDQLAFIEQAGGKELADKQRAANTLFAEMYSKRDELKTLFGKDLSGSVVPLIRRAITSGAKGDAQALEKAIANVPEELRGKVLLSGLLAESTGRGAMGGFSFANFAKTYRGLRQNAPVYKRFSEYLGPQGDQTLVDLYAISRRMAEAESRVLKTGKANQALVGQLNAEALLGKVVKSTMGRGAASVAAAAGGGPAAAGATVLATELLDRAGGVARTDKLHRLLSSEDFRSLMEKMGSGAPTEGAIKRVASSRPFIEFSRRIPGLRNFTSRVEWLKAASSQSAVNIIPNPETVEAPQ